MPPLGAKKKYVPCILKYKAHILKFKARIFGCLQTRMNKGFAPNVKCGQNGAMRGGGGFYSFQPEMLSWIFHRRE